jgi:hypothetical protein
MNQVPTTRIHRRRTTRDMSALIVSAGANCAALLTRLVAVIRRSGRFGGLEHPHELKPQRSVTRTKSRSLQRNNPLQSSPRPLHTNINNTQLNSAPSYATHYHAQASSITAHTPYNLTPLHTPDQVKIIRASVQRDNPFTSPRPLH